MLASVRIHSDTQRGLDVSSNLTGLFLGSTLRLGHRATLSTASLHILYPYLFSALFVMFVWPLCSFSPVRDPPRYDLSHSPSSVYSRDLCSHCIACLVLWIYAVIGGYGDPHTYDICLDSRRCLVRVPRRIIFYSFCHIRSMTPLVLSLDTSYS